MPVRSSSALVAAAPFALWCCARGVGRLNSMCHPGDSLSRNTPKQAMRFNRVCESDCTDLPHQLCLSVHASSINPILCGLERRPHPWMWTFLRPARRPHADVRLRADAARGGVSRVAGEEGGIRKNRVMTVRQMKKHRIRLKRSRSSWQTARERTIQHMMATTFWSPDGKPISAAQFVERLFGELPRFFKDEDELRRIWSQPDTRKALL